MISSDDAYRAGHQDAWDGEPMNKDYGEDMGDKYMQGEYNQGYRDFKAGIYQSWVINNA